MVVVVKCVVWCLHRGRNKCCVARKGERRRVVWGSRVDKLLLGQDALDSAHAALGWSRWARGEGDSPGGFTGWIHSRHVIHRQHSACAVSYCIVRYPPLHAALSRRLGPIGLSSITCGRTDIPAECEEKVEDSSVDYARSCRRFTRTIL